MKNLYRSIGLPWDTWRSLDGARTSRICSEVLGSNPTESDLVRWILRLGFARLEQLEEQETTQDRNYYLPEVLS